MTTFNDINGLTIVGFRFGEAPKSGRSWNYMTNTSECGVSMAQVGYDREICSFATSEASKRKKYYYVGEICGTGGDDEICLKNVVRITYREYCRKRKEMIEQSNAVVNYRYDRKLNLIERGFNISSTTDEIENERNKYLR